jgi:hypothetical protein
MSGVYEMSSCPFGIDDNGDDTVKMVVMMMMTSFSAKGAAEYQSGGI